MESYMKCQSKSIGEADEGLARELHRQVPVIVDDERDGLKENGVFGVGVLDLLGLGWLLGFVQDGLQALHQPAFDGAILWRGVALQQSQQLAGEPGRRHKVIGVVLQVSGG